MTDLEAIEIRQSRRTYCEQPISEEHAVLIETLIEKLNKTGGLSIKFVKNNPQAFQGLNPAYGMFRGVSSYFAMIGKTTDKALREKIGYYGELLVLEATKLGLGTCWVGGTFNKKNCACTLFKDETIVCIITVGYVADKKSFKENAIYKMVHRKTKTAEEMYTSDTPAPDWFLSGMKAVQKAPSAVNKQPVFFTLKEGTVTAKVPEAASYQEIDLGIAKAHFELGAGGSFELGNGALFHKE